ncbi:hypothetical protein G6F53_014193 [Rhizopus delemar]|nr:hypothetical protein G6F53_014193 [Rhizopus delemar]
MMPRAGRHRLDLRAAGPVRGGDAGGRPPGHSVDPRTHCRYRLARTVHAVGAGDRAGRGVRLGDAVRRFVRAGRVLRRHAAQRIGTEPQGRA